MKQLSREEFIKLRKLSNKYKDKSVMNKVTKVEHNYICNYENDLNPLWANSGKPLKFVTLIFALFSFLPFGFDLLRGIVNLNLFVITFWGFLFSFIFYIISRKHDKVLDSFKHADYECSDAIVYGYYIEKDNETNSLVTYFVVSVKEGYKVTEVIGGRLDEALDYDLVGLNIKLLRFNYGKIYKYAIVIY